MLLNGVATVHSAHEVYDGSMVRSTHRFGPIVGTVTAGDAVGAPVDKGAGVRIRVAVGDEVAADDVLAEAVASNQSGIDAIRPGAAEEMFSLT